MWPIPGQCGCDWDKSDADKAGRERERERERKREERERNHSLPFSACCCGNNTARAAKQASAKYELIAFCLNRFMQTTSENFLARH